MNEKFYERLLDLLTGDDLVDSMVADVASLLSEQHAASEDLAGAAVWQQVATDSGQPPDQPAYRDRHLGFDDRTGGEHHLPSSWAWQDRTRE